METMEVTMDGKSYVLAEEYHKLENKLSELNSRATEDAYKAIEAGRYWAVVIETFSERMTLDRKTVELTHEKAFLAKKLKHAIELPDCRPISVAKALIDMDRLFYKDGTEYEGFTRKQLRQIAEHLLVYCNEGREKK